MPGPKRSGVFAGLPRLAAAACCVVVGLLGAGCAGPGAAGPGADPGETVTIWRSLDQYVRVEPRDDAGDPAAVPNEHPVELSPDDLGSFLGAVLARRGSSGEPAPVFAPDQLEVLTRELPEAFRRAGPRQDVTFGVMDAKRVAFGIGTGPTLATGRAFVQGGGLNLIFGDVHRRVDLYSGRPVEPFVPGSRQPRSARDQGFTLETTPEASRAITLVRSDWVRADLAALAAIPTPTPALPPTPGAPAAVPAPGEPDAPFAERPAPTLETSPPGPSAVRPAEARSPEEPGPLAVSPKAASASESASPPAAPSAAPPVKPLSEPEAALPSSATGSAASPKARQDLESVQQRLWVLEELRRKGLVSEEEYRASRARILSEL